MEWRHILFTLLVLLTELPVSAQVLRQFSRYSIEDGLSLSVVTAIEQDRRGFIWLGTQDGLNRYDGFQFDIYRHKPGEKNSLSESHITTLEASSEGGIWIGTARGLDYFNAEKEQFRSISFESVDPHSVYVTDLLEIAGEGLWIGSNQGLYWLPEQQTTATHIKVDENDNRSSIISLSLRLSEVLVSRQDGIFKLTRNGTRIERVSALDGLRVYRFLIDDSGDTLLGTENGVLHFDWKKSVLSSKVHLWNSCKKPELLNKPVQDLLRDSNGAIWIATAVGVSVIEKNRDCNQYQQGRQHQDGLSRSDVLSLFSDRDGAVWLGTYAGGVNKWNAHSIHWRHHLSNDEKNSSPVLSILKDRQKRLWLGTSDHGVLRADDEYNFSPVTIKSESKVIAIDAVNAIHEDVDGDIWIGTQGYGLIRSIKGSEKYQQYVPEKARINSISGDFVFTIMQSRNGDIWIGTDAGFDKLILQPDNTIEFRRYATHFPIAMTEQGIQVDAIVEDWKGRLWLAGTFGLVGFDPITEEFIDPFLIHQKPATFSNTIHSLMINADGDLWIGTAAGLWRMRVIDNNFVFESVKASLFDKGIGIYSLSAGIDGELWAGTNSGLLRYDPTKQESILFRSGQGLMTDEYNAQAVYSDSDSTLYFGHIAGALSFNTKQMVLPTSPQTTHLIRWRIFDTTQVMPVSGKMLTIPSDSRVLSFDFSLLSYDASHRHQLRYRLKGLHDNWVNLESSRRVVLTGLNPGDYGLEVQAANAYGQWSLTSFELPLQITSTTWSLQKKFWIAIILLCGMAFILSFALYRQKKKVDRERIDLQRATELQRLSLEKRLRDLISERSEIEFKLHDREKSLVDLGLQLDKQGRLDSLTGLPNRLAFLEHFNEALSNNSNEQKALLLIDIDGMRYVNENFGQRAGDQLLVQFSDLLMRISRGDDKIFRFGEDAFILWSSLQHVNEVSSLAERVRLSVLQKAFALAGRRRIDLTCSIGFSIWPLLPDDINNHQIDALTSLAERALFLAKLNGRNAWVGVLPIAENTGNDSKLFCSKPLSELLEQKKVHVLTSISLAMPLQINISDTPSS